MKVKTSKESVGSTTGAQKQKVASKAKSSCQWNKRMTVLLLEPVSFSGIESRAKAKLRNLICTLKTAQPDGKHLVKKPVAKR